MYSIYFNNRCIAVCSSREQFLNEPNAVLYYSDSESDLSDLPVIFQSSPDIKKLYIQSDHEDETFRRLCSKLTQIDAGGGIVTNHKGEFLLIFRHGMWDLPKGKQEPNEDIRESAIREVEEECGVHDLQIKEHICETYHTYELNGKFILKCTHWYKMSYLGNGLDTAPQKEEDIERAVWVKPGDLPTYLAHTYPSIIEVFGRASS